MNILGIGIKKLVVRTRACQKFFKPADKRRVFLRAQHRGAREPVGVSDARTDIGLEEPPVKPERVVKLTESFIGPFGKTSAPEILAICHSLYPPSETSKRRQPGGDCY